ncbi:MAG: CHAT domain-containing protein [Chitinophagaceae bacterium]
MTRRMITCLMTFVIITCSLQVHAQSAIDIFNKAEEALNEGKYLQAMTLVEQSLEKAKKDSGNASLQYAAVADNASTFYILMEMFDMAQRLGTAAGNIYLFFKGKTSMEYAGTRINLANICMKKGEYVKAASLLREAENVIDSLKADTTTAYAYLLDAKANLGQFTGNNNVAIHLHQRAAEIYKKYHPAALSDYVYIVNNLAQAYTMAGIYDKAELALKETGTLFDKLGVNHPVYSTYITNVGTLNMQKGNLEAAQTQYKKAAAALAAKAIPGDDTYLLLLNNIGYLYILQRKFTEADSVFNDILARLKRSKGEKTIAAVRALGNKGVLCQQMGQWQEADSAFTRAITYLKPLVGEHHPDYITLQINLAAVRMKTGNTAVAVAQLGQANEALMHYWQRSFPGLSEKEKLSMAYTIAQSINILPSLLHSGDVPLTPAIITQLYKEQVSYRGAVLMEQRDVVLAVSRLHDPAVTATYERGVQARQMLVKQESLMYRSKKITDSLQRVVEETEQQLSWKLASLNRSLGWENITPAAVSKTLQPGEAAIEFINFQYYNNDWTDSVFYGALILTHGDSVPAFVPLAENRQLLQLMRKSGNVNSKSLLLSQLYPDVNMVANIKATRGYKLFELVLKPLLPYLKQTKKIYIAPAGVLHEIALQALPVGNKRLLGDDFQLHYLFSTRTLLNRQDEAVNKTASLWGGIQFSTTSKKNTEWASLPYTLTEVNNISAQLGKAAFKVDTYTGTGATKTAFFNTIKNNPGILHIATHGYYTSDNLSGKQLFRTLFTGETPVAPDPLLRCGLIVSPGTTGGNNNEEKLTGYEIAGADLSNTSLVTLSACETALGDLHSSEGVFGLQRAFKLAGVHYIIMSLWRVPDKPTAELMTAFYSNLAKGQTITDAFTDAKLQFRKKYPPYYWAGFTLIE